MPIGWEKRLPSSLPELAAQEAQEGQEKQKAFQALGLGALGIGLLAVGPFVVMPFIIKSFYPGMSYGRRVGIGLGITAGLGALRGLIRSASGGE